MTADPDLRARLRALPAVGRLAADVAARAGVTAADATAAARAVLAARRAELRAGPEAPAGDEDLVARACAWLRPSLRRVINATGVIIHTNLGRAPLAGAAAEAVTDAARGYVSLELDLVTGTRGHRD